jgi:hypothetical protein
VKLFHRYTTAYGLWSNQLLNQNYGYDVPMAYGEVFIPQVMEGLMLRFGRFISIPDIEAQLAPNNYMYTHRRRGFSALIRTDA